jgi:hypothetical protein
VANMAFQVKETFSLTQSFLPIMGGYAIDTTSGYRFRLDSYQFYTLVKSGEIQVPSVTNEEINDRSKGDWVTKSVSCLQVSWLAAQLAGRAFQRLPVTTLEIFTLATTICTLTTYGFWWSKPINICQLLVFQKVESGIA